MRTYHNRWIPSEARAILEAHTGTLLDVGGGVSPFAKATHVMDIAPFDQERLQANVWPAEMPANTWMEKDYTVLDIVAEREWPFETNQFDLGLSSHCFEDLRDPLPAIKEFSRVCRKVLIICPSRLMEQTRGIEHPRWCGFLHHPWMVYTDDDNRLIIRRKTPLFQLPEAHITCPLGKTLKVDDGSMYWYGEKPEAEEAMFESQAADYAELASFIEPYRGRRDIFINDVSPPSWLRRVYRLRQKWFGKF